MSREYNNHFKKAKNNKKSAASNDVEAKLRSKINMHNPVVKNKKPRPPVFAISVLIFGLAGAYYGSSNIETVEQYVDLIEFEIFGAANAAEGEVKDQNQGQKTDANSSQTQAGGAANSTSGGAPNKKSECVEMKGFTQEELSHFNKLNERKNELDRRDAELTTLEEELHKQRLEVEERITKLERIREEVAGVLKERVEVDQQKVSTLVDFYSNMKPKQAADIFSNLNEDLAVEVLGRMKKKSAADILNLLEPAKARALSEKFTGYKRR